VQSNAPPFARRIRKSHAPPECSKLALSARTKIWWPAWFRIRYIRGDIAPDTITSSNCHDGTAIVTKHGRDIVQALAERRRAVTSGQMIRQIEGRAKTRARCHWHALGRSGLSRPLLPLSEPNAFPMPRCSARAREARLSRDFENSTARSVSTAGIGRASRLN